MAETYDSVAELVETVLCGCATIGLVALTRKLIARPYRVMSSSMRPTLVEGDRIVGERVSLKHNPPRSGDIVFLRDPDGSGDILLKRVIATAGQVIDIAGGSVIVDGVTLDEPYAAGNPTSPLGSSAAFPHVVPEGYVWVMGDNRSNSLDSRSFGAVDVRDVEARAVCIYWPPSHARSLMANARKASEGGEDDA